MTLLPAKTFDLIHGHSGDADGLKLLFHGVECKGLDNRLDLFHSTFLIRRWTSVGHAAGARQANQVTAIATPATAGIGGTPTRKIAVTSAITPVPIVSAIWRCRVSVVKCCLVILHAVAYAAVC